MWVWVFYSSVAPMRLPSWLALPALVASQAVVNVPVGASTFKILHISDVHFHPQETTCRDVEPSEFPCTHENSTQMIHALIEKEKPSLVAFTGDAIDHDSDTPRHAMDVLYGTVDVTSQPWAASLGNHESQVQNMTREAVYSHILTMPSLSTHGPVADSPGNFYVDLVQEGNVATRLFFFDSRDDLEMSVSDAQLEWFANLTSSLPAAPALAFYHIPLAEYETAVRAGQPIKGGLREQISADKPNPRTFQALKDGGVIAGFCGHDHTNDFCVSWEGVQLCYEGSPGFGAYGYCGPLKQACVARRARVTELWMDSGQLTAVHSWKRVDGGGASAGAKVDAEQLWPSLAGHHPSAEAVAEPYAHKLPSSEGRVAKSVDELAALVQHKQLSARAPAPIRIAPS